MSHRTGASGAGRLGIGGPFDALHIEWAACLPGRRLAGQYKDGNPSMANRYTQGEAMRPHRPYLRKYT